LFYPFLADCRLHSLPHANAISPCVLHRVHRAVGVVEQDIDVTAGFVAFCNPHADGYFQIISIHLLTSGHFKERLSFSKGHLFDHGAKAGCHLRRLFKVGIWQNSGKFLAAQPAEYIHAAQGFHAA